jgi:hypothetical protein
VVADLDRDVCQTRADPALRLPPRPARDIAVYEMHPIEHRRRHDRLKHLPRGRHFMDFIEKEFFRCRHADQKREVRGKEDDDDSGNSVP